MALCLGWQLDLVPLSLRSQRSIAGPNQRLARTLKTLQCLSYKGLEWREAAMNYPGERKQLEETIRLFQKPAFSGLI